MTKLIAGLGNPGPKYEKTKHNVGFMTVDAIAKKHGVKFKHEKTFEADVADFFVGTEKIILVKPTTFMNDSGRAIGPLLTYFNVAVEDFLIIYDDLDMVTGKLRLRAKGSAGGHNGVKSTISYVGTQEFKRIKIGIGRPEHGKTVVSHVLSGFSKTALPEVLLAIDTAVNAAEEFSEGVDFVDVMNHYNKK
jgi:PTH1 family peptidyl-tRNA hydrolase